MPIFYSDPNIPNIPSWYVQLCSTLTIAIGQNLNRNVKMRVIIVILCLFFSSISVADDPKGNLHAVINKDGEISYYVIRQDKQSKTDDNKKINKEELKDIPKVGTEVFEVKERNKEVVGYLVSEPSSKNDKQLKSLKEIGLTTDRVDFNSLPKYFNQGYKLTGPGGKVSGAWLPKDDSKTPDLIPSLTLDNHTLVTMGKTSKTDILSVFSVPLDEAREYISNTLARQAKSIACSMKVRPNQFSVGLALGASFEIVASGQGEVSFQGSWDTDVLCED